MEAEYVVCVILSIVQVMVTRIEATANGNWGPWLNGSCSVTCGGGTLNRTRLCDNPPPSHGESCVGKSIDVQKCNENLCQGVAKTARVTFADSTGVAIGASVGVIVVIIMVIVYIISKKRYVRLDPDDGNGVYLNVTDQASCMISTDTDDDIMQPFGIVMEAETNIKVEDLGDYIKERQMKEELQKEYEAFPKGVQYPTTVATKEENKSKNQFIGIFPYDHTRVVLHNGADYINASFINGFERERCYIASQDPKRATWVDHWRMIWQLHVSRIITLSTEDCSYRRIRVQYWPYDDETLSLGNFVLSLISERKRATFVTRQISIEEKTTNEIRTVVQYHFTSWSDNGTPNPLDLALFHRHVLSEDSASDTGPLLVHCRAGIGRTGMYIGLDALYEQGKTTGYIDVPAFVKKMRYCRMNMVQKQEQYVCLHQALHEAFTMTDTKINKNEFGMVWRKILSDNRRILREEYKMLEEKRADHATRDYTLAKSPKNKDKNRCMAVLPADNDRVSLSSFEKGRTDYINAVIAPSYTNLIGYITTQLPLPETKVDFWTMITDHWSSIIVLFVKDQTEADFVYSTSPATGSLGQNTLQILSNTDEDGIIVVSVTLYKKDVKQEDVVIYQIVSDGLPEAKVLCKLFNLMSTRITMAEGPVTVVSGDGAKICGLLCAFINAVSSMLIDENADIFQLVRLLQVRRPEFFKDFEEYQKVYEAVNFYTNF